MRKLIPGEGMGKQASFVSQEHFEHTRKASPSIQNMSEMISLSSELLGLLKQMVGLIAMCRNIARETDTAIIPDVIYTEAEVCRFLKITRKSLRIMISEGRIDACRVPGDEFRIPGHNIVTFLNGGSFIQNNGEESLLCEKESSISENFLADYSETDF